MNKKIKNYVDVLFSDIPRTRRAAELKEELLGNMSERFEDCIAQGKSENEAYTETVAGLGDVDSLLAELQPQIELKKEADFYRIRRARVTAISVAMYILGAAILIGFAWMTELNKGANEDSIMLLGVIILLVIVAVATGMIIYVNLIIPNELKPYLNMEEEDDSFGRTPIGHVFGLINSVMWLFITAVYLGISFYTMRWDITWVVWIIGAVMHGVLKVIYHLIEPAASKII
ncbi:MAG: permease prefix domain 1-containing protein [Oscillospiraceae bacterium]|nr:permease prefix domain 1-containing protein [Oscillospiraceae bacterium]